MLSKKDLQRLQSVDIEKVDKASLVDISGVKLDNSLPLPERFSFFIDQIQNPFAFRVGKCAVKVEYAGNGKTLHDAFARYLRALRASC